MEPKKSDPTPPMNPREIAAAFHIEGNVASVSPFGDGNINLTRLVSTDSPSKTRYILQRINPDVFPFPLKIIENIRILSDHFRKTDKNRTTPSPEQRWEFPGLIPSVTGEDYIMDAEGGIWRLMRFIENTVSCSRVQSIDQAREIGYALGRFHRDLRTLKPDKLHDTLPGFHITPQYVAAYEAAAAKVNRNAPDSRERFCHKSIETRKRKCSVLEEEKAAGHLAIRPIHGDPKINNILFDQNSGKAVSMIDLDTVKPGLLLYDIGDCLRSACNPLGEETDRFGEVEFETDIAEAILSGYLSQAGTCLTERDVNLIYTSAWIMTLELGIRFFTDYLMGNRYFKTKRADQNLDRACVQFRLVESIEKKARGVNRLAF